MSHLFWLLENGKVFFLFISKCCKQIQIAMWNHEGGKIRNENWKINMIVILPPPYILPYWISKNIIPPHKLHSYLVGLIFAAGNIQPTSPWHKSWPLQRTFLSTDEIVRFDWKPHSIYWYPRPFLLQRWD